jgi:hypothetical protein
LRELIVLPPLIGVLSVDFAMIKSLCPEKKKETVYFLSGFSYKLMIIVQLGHGVGRN